MNPIVSIASITYNHGKFIAQAIESWLVQRTDFNIEIVIGEDCSTDNTREIIESYREKHPKLFRVITSETNVGMMPNFIRTLEACKGKYIALCEGDDYWTDPHKLQKQVDFLEGNEDYSICSHNVTVVKENEETSNTYWSWKENKSFTIEDLSKGNIISTPSVVFRNQPKLVIPEYFKNLPVGDYPLHLLNAQFGKIYIFSNAMGIYRIHGGGSWFFQQSFKKHHEWVFLLEAIEDKFDRTIKQNLIKQKEKSLHFLLKYYDEQNDCNNYQQILKKLNKDNPKSIAELLRQNEHLVRKLDEYNSIKHLIKDLIKRLRNKLFNSR